MCAVSRQWRPARFTAVDNCSANVPRDRDLNCAFYLIAAFARSASARYIAAGGLMSYGNDVGPVTAGGLCRPDIKGEKPADLPVQCRSSSNSSSISRPPRRSASSSAIAARPRRRGDRMSAPGKAGAIQPVEVRLK